VSVMALFFFLVANVAHSDEEGTRNVLKQGLLGAGTGAIASGASGGNAGTGALIGAGTGVIGGALLDAITAPPASSSSSRRSAAPQQTQYYDDQGNYDDGQEYYEEEPPQESTGSKVIKQGLLGAGTGAIASGMSGGSAGKGALIGAGTGVIGGALLDMMTQPSQPRRVYRRAPARQQPQQAVRVQQPQASARVQQPGDDEPEAAVTGTSRKKVVRKYDDSGKVVSEEEIYY
ncbi:MAG: glycine zipper family protein, partial [Candidatus Omnitrophica bacterium]|nr:glycine zipper family protein [Candidatus Omnitrophota bacterium]